MKNAKGRPETAKYQTSNAIMSTAIAKVDRSLELAKEYQISESMLRVIEEQICQGASPAERDMFIAYCGRTKLDPVAKQIYCIMRWDSRLKREKMSIQASIDGLRLIAERSGKYQGQTAPEWCGDDGVWRDIWPKLTPPFAARIGVFKQGFTHPTYAVAKFQHYAQRFKDGALMGQWASMPDLMISKCAEALALRKAFPNETSGVYTSEEMAQAEPVTDEPKPAQRVDVEEAELVVIPEPVDAPAPKQGKVKLIQAASANLQKCGAKSAQDCVAMLFSIGIGANVGDDGKIIWDFSQEDLETISNVTFGAPKSDEDKPDVVEQAIIDKAFQQLADIPQELIPAVLHEAERIHPGFTEEVKAIVDEGKKLQSVDDAQFYISTSAVPEEKKELVRVARTNLRACGATVRILLANIPGFQAPADNKINWDSIPVEQLADIARLRRVAK